MNYDEARFALDAGRTGGGPALRQVIQTTTYAAATQTVNQQENAVSEMNRKLLKSADIMAAVCGDYGQSRVISTFNHANFEHDNYYSKIGMHQNFGLNYAAKQIESIGNSGSNSFSFDNTRATDVQVQRLLDSGNPIRRMGIQENTKDARSIQSAHELYQKEMLKNQTATIAHSKNDKIAIMRDVQAKGQDYVKNSSSYLRENFKINAATGKSNAHALLRDSHTSDRDRAVIREYLDHGGNINLKNVGSAAQRGRSAILRSCVGNDMMKGVDTMRAVKVVTTSAARVVTGGVIKGTYKTSSKVNGLAQRAATKVCRNSNVLTKRLDEIQSRKITRYNARKERVEAHKIGGNTLKRYKIKRKNERWIKKGNRINHKIERSLKIKNGPLTPKETRELRRLEIKNRIHTNRKTLYQYRSSIKIKRVKITNRIKNVTSRIGRVVFAPARVLLAPIKAFSSIVNKIKMKLIAVVGIFFCNLLIYMLKFMSLGITAYFVLHFIADVSVVGILNSPNYVQLIVDTTTEDIATDFVTISEVDATFHFINKNPIKHPDYPWYKTPNKGSIQHLWAWEEADNTTRWYNKNDKADFPTGDLMYIRTYVPQDDRQELSSITENMLPIVSMMHTRYLNKIDFSNWETGLGYTYYMFSVSHDVARYDTNAHYKRNEYHDYSDDPGYDYGFIADCAPNTLYSEAPKYNRETGEFKRGEEQCNNIFVHDFPQTDFVNSPLYQIHKSPSYESRNSVSGAGAELINGLQGTKIFQALSEVLKNKFNYNLNNIAESNEGDLLDGYQLGVSGYLLQMRSIALKKNGTNHVNWEYLDYNVPQMAELSKNVTVHPNDSGWFVYDGTQSSLPHDEKGTLCNNIGCDQYGKSGSQEELIAYWKSKGAYNGAGPQWKDGPIGVDEADEYCHVHTYECYEGIDTLYREEKGTKYVDGVEIEYTEQVPYHIHYDEITPGVTKCAHVHKPWHSYEDPGCYMSVVYCNGHCGGHIDPYINIVEKMSWNGLAQDDQFKTTYWLSAEEVSGGDGGNIVGGTVYRYTSIFGFLDTLCSNRVVTIAEFKTYWKLKATSWFSPYPRSPYSAIKTYNKHYIMNFAEGVDNCKSFFWNLAGGDSLNTSWNKTFGSKKTTSDDDWNTLTATEDGDANNFAGWFLNEFEMDPTIKGDLMVWYGDLYKNDETNSESYGARNMQGFEDGIAMWKFFDVEFKSVGRCTVPPLTEEEIQALLDSIKKQYPGISATRLRLLEEAFNQVGKWGYSMGGHSNLYNGEAGGVTDCSGFISGVFKLCGIDTGLICAAEWANKGTIGGPLMAGTIVAKKKGANEAGSYTGHVMMVVKTYPDGSCDVADCTTVASQNINGVSVRHVSGSKMSEYKYHYNID